MRIYWTLRSIPELADVPAKDRRRIWRVAYGRTFMDWRGWAALALVGLGVIVGRVIGSAYGYDTLGSLIGVGIASAIYGQVATRLAIPHLRETIGSNRAS